MTGDANIYSDPKLWISVLSLAVAIWAALNSTRSRNVATRALAISEQQEQRRQPRLEINILDCYRQSFTSHQLFAFLVSITNPSDVNNSISLAELQLGYVMDGGIKMKCRMPHDAKPSILPGTDSSAAIAVPSRIDAHQTTKGWLYFVIDNGLLNGRTVEGQTILVVDTHGNVAEATSILVKEIG